MDLLTTPVGVMLQDEARNDSYFWLAKLTMMHRTEKQKMLYSPCRKNLTGSDLSGLRGTLRDYQLC